MKVFFQGSDQWRQLDSHVLTTEQIAAIGGPASLGIDGFSCVVPDESDESDDESDDESENEGSDSLILCGTRNSSYYSKVSCNKQSAKSRSH